MRLASISDRVRRSFTATLEQDELEALVEPAVGELFTGSPAGAGDSLERRADSFLGVASGSGVEVPDWLERLSGTVDRAIEFFMPVGQSGESQQWITASMRLLSLAARGGFLERALSDMCKVAWDRGPVRHGHKTREDGTRIPLWHDSEVAAIAFAIQNILVLRATQPDISTLPEALGEAGEMASTAFATAATQTVVKGKKCSDCGAHAVIRKDGCDYCTQCGYLGSCG